MIQPMQILNSFCCLYPHALSMSSLFFFKNLFIYFFCVAALGLRCCAQASSSCSEWGLLFIVVHGLLIAVASLVAEHKL